MTEDLQQCIERLETELKDALKRAMDAIAVLERRIESTEEDVKSLNYTVYKDD